MDAQFRIALSGTPLRYKKKFVKIPYQFVHGMNLSAEAMWKLVQPHLDRVKAMLKNPKKPLIPNETSAITICTTISSTPFPYKR